MDAKDGTAKVREGDGMPTRPAPPPWGALITSALREAGLSAREAARRAGLSEGRWRQITSGYQVVSAGVYAPVRGPAGTLARMAAVAGLAVPARASRASGRGGSAGRLPDGRRGRRCRRDPAPGPGNEYRAGPRTAGHDRRAAWHHAGRPGHSELPRGRGPGPERRRGTWRAAKRGRIARKLSSARERPTSPPGPALARLGACPGHHPGQAPARSLARRAGHRHPLPAVQEAANFALAVATVTARSADRRQLPAARPTRHGLRVHPEHGCNLGRGEQAVLRLDLGSHGAGPLTLGGSWSVTESS